MALRLGDHVVAGELINRRSYMTHGWFALRGDDTPIIFQLTGNCAGELRGKHIRFSIPDERALPDQPSPLDKKSLAHQQIGPTGEITIRQMGHSLESARPCLYMEWFSQNGRVVIELLDPEIEWVEEDEDDRQRASEASTAVELGEDDIFIPDEDDADEDDALDPFDVPPPDADEELDDPYGLFPPGLDDELAGDSPEELAAKAADEPESTGKRSWDEVVPGIDPETKRMYEDWDEVTEGTQDVPFTEVFDPPVRVHSAEQLYALSDDEAEAALRELLVRLALLGVAVAVCDHFTPRLTYRMIAQEILPKYGVHPRLPQIGWVQHYDTSEFCRKCEERFDREYEERRRKEEGEGEAPADSDPQAL